LIAKKNQETKDRYELWQKLEDGRLIMLRSWNKKSLLFITIDFNLITN